MTEDGALLALKNAWNGAVATSDQLRELAPTVLGAPDDAPLENLDLDACHNAALAHANAAQALRGLIEELRRKAAAG